MCYATAEGTIQYKQRHVWAHPANTAGYFRPTHPGIICVFVCCLGHYDYGHQRISSGHMTQKIKLVKVKLFTECYNTFLVYVRGYYKSAGTSNNQM